MKICPNCRDEFLEHVTTCAPCQTPLLSKEAAASLPTIQENLSKEEFLSGGAVALLEGNLDACREVEFTLKQAKISSVVFPLSTKGNGEEGVLGAFSAMKYAVLVQPDKLENCKEVLQSHFRHQVAREGKGALVEHAVDFSMGDAACPACGHVGGLEQDECLSCGLFLGGERK